MAKNGFSMSKRVAVEILSGSGVSGGDTVVLNELDCGKTFFVFAGGNVLGKSAVQTSSTTIQLPLLATAGDGWNCKFVMTSGSTTGVANQDIIISGSADDGLTTPASKPFIIYMRAGLGTDRLPDTTNVIISGSVLLDGDIVEVWTGKDAEGVRKWYVDASGVSGSVTTT